MRFVAYSSLLVLLFTTGALSAAPEPEPPAAPATTAPSEADELKASGDAAMRRLEYAAALDFYERSYALSPNPSLLYNKGRALQALRRFPEAVDQIEAFSREASPELKARVPKLDELLADLQKRVSTLEIVSNVSGARVLLRRQTLGTTPLARLRVNAGTATLEVLADGHHPFSRKVTLPPGGTLRVEARLHSKTTTGVLEISSPVAGASVYVNGRRVGAAPAQTVLRAGEHRVLVRHEGYDDAETSAVISAGRTTRLDVPLDQPPPITARWWFWTGVGVVVVAGAAVTVALLTERDPDQGDIPPGQVAGPLVSF